MPLGTSWEGAASLDVRARRPVDSVPRTWVAVRTVASREGPHGDKEPYRCSTCLPPCATTGVGSLPFADVDEAVAHVAAAYDVPFCPQLPLLEGDMVAEWLGADPCCCGWSPERDRERPRAWEAFLDEVSARPPEHGVVKLQVTGPVDAGHRAGRHRRWPASWRRGWPPPRPTRCGRCASATWTRCWWSTSRRWSRRRRRRPRPPPPGTRCGPWRRPGDCTCAAGCRGTWSSARVPTCSASTWPAPAGWTATPRARWSGCSGAARGWRGASARWAPATRSAPRRAGWPRPWPRWARAASAARRCSRAAC